MTYTLSRLKEPQHAHDDVHLRLPRLPAPLGQPGGLWNAKPVPQMPRFANLAQACSVEGLPVDESRLFEDVHAAKIVRELEVAQSSSDLPSLQMGRLRAMERGRRQRPDGTVEDYDRLEFYERL